jgi:Outer membrane receptor proteins, mostly Fe transport
MNDALIMRALVGSFFVLTVAAVFRPLQGATPAAADPATAGEAELEILEPIEVVGVTPLHGVGLSLNEIPSNVQTATGDTIEATDSLDLTQFMNRNLGSVFINEAQNNPLQPDVQFRGFVASPLLGLPQGLSVYQNGVRINEPFGDTVQWALVPQSAIASINLIPGSNPLFGLNTLGGALSIQTKTGFTHPGVSSKVYGGSFGRVVVEAEAGGHSGDTGFGEVGYFLTFNYFDESGWRDFSPSEAKNLFADIGWRGAASSLNLNITWADTDLIGNGPAPIQLLEREGRSAIFTRPDQTENSLIMLSLLGSHQFTPEIITDANGYWRRSNIDTLNGDDSDFEACADPFPAGFVCLKERGPGGEELKQVFDPAGNPIPFSDAVDGATINITRTEQNSYGGQLQTTFLYDILGHQNQFIAGGAIDRSSMAFDARTALGELDETRQAVASGFLVGFIGAVEPDAAGPTRVDADTHQYGVFFTDTFSLTDALSLTVSGRYNRTQIELRDKIGTALTGNHIFDRFNPAAGLTYRFAPALQVYGGYSESNRAPTPVELTCADVDDPCRLPNAFLADPPLAQVIARTWDAGLRGVWRGIDWHTGYFRTTNEDDILFISAGALTNQGFFDNVGTTRREGLELNLSGSVSRPEWFINRLDWFINYTFLEATFRENFRVASPNNPTAVDGEVEVERGDRILLVPKHLFKAGGNYFLTPKLSIGGELLYQSNQFLRGDEGNDVDPLPGFGVVNLFGEYRFPKYLSVFVKIDNLLDKGYGTFGLFGEPKGVLGEAFDDPRFVSPGAPRGVFGGIKLSL